MRFFTRFAACAAMTMAALSASDVLAQVRISQAFGAGNFSATVPAVDYVEIFNSGTTAVDLTGWSVQLAWTATVAWNVIPLSGTIGPGEYRLIQAYAPAGTTGTPLPTPDFSGTSTDTTILFSSEGLVALSNSATAFATGCPLGNAALVDYMSWGGSHSCIEGSTRAPSSTSALAVFRKFGGCQDTNNNLNDLEYLAPAPRNSASPANPGGGAPIFASSASPIIVGQGGATIITSTITACVATPPSLTSVTGDLSALGGSPTAAFTGGPFLWSLPVGISVSQTPGNYTISISGTDGVTTYSSSALITVTPPPAPNDDCANAVNLTGATFPATAIVNNGSSTADIDPGTCNTGTVGNFGVWYRFDATTSGIFTVTEASTQDIASGIWTVPTSSATCPTATTGAVCNSAESYSFAVAAGNTYYIQIGSSTATAPTVPLDLTFNLEVVAAPANDLCANATVLSTFPFSLNVDNRAATSDLDPGTCNTGTVGNFGVWYRLDATVSGIVTISETSTQDIASGVWVVPTSSAACPASGVATPCNSAESFSFAAVAGNTYFIQIGNTVATLPTANLAGTINFEVVPSPANDTCATAASLTTFPASFVIDNRTAGDEFDIGTCNTSSTRGNNGVWFRYDATTSGTLLLQETSAQDIATAWYTIPTATFACPASSAGSTCNSAESFTVAVTAGNTYLFLVTNSPDALPTVAMNITFRFFATPVNDECTNAADLVPGNFVVSTFSATSSAAPFNSIPCPTTASAIFNDVWFKWTAPSAGRIGFVANNGTTTSVRYVIYDGGVSPGACPTTNVGLGCAASPTVVNTDPAAPLSVVAGRTYYFQIGTTASTTFGLTEFTLAYIPDVVGSCCVGSACSIQSAAACASASGTYNGDASLCSATLTTVSTYTGGSIGAIVDSASGSGASAVSTFTLNVPDTFAVHNLELDLNLTHTFNSDLTIVLSKDGRSATMFNRGRRGLIGTQNIATDFTGAYTFSDAGAALITDQLAVGTPTVMTPGTYRPTTVGTLPVSIRNAFNGVQASGVWTLTITDGATIDSGTLASWGLKLTRGVDPSCAPPTVVCCRGSTCSIVAAAACTTTGFGAGALPLVGSTCNASGVNTTPCCLADYNKSGTVAGDVPDIFAFLGDWFANSPYAFFGGDGTGTGSPGVPAIFAFLGAWFAGCP